MVRQRTELEKAAGKLVSAIQKEWGKELGKQHSETTENVMDAAHDILKAKTVSNVKKLLGQRTIRQYLGEIWIQKHSNIKPMITAIEEILNKDTPDHI